ncbi:MAG: hypothetical protein AB1545_10380 [Thermodesulfobacteriota bacterium]
MTKKLQISDCGFQSRITHEPCAIVHEPSAITHPPLASAPPNGYNKKKQQEK